MPPNRTPPNIANSLPPLQQQADDLQEVLVPADGDAVLGDAAEPRHHAVVERFVDAREMSRIGWNGYALAERIDAGESAGQRLDLQAVDARRRCGRRSSDDAPA